MLLFFEKYWIKDLHVSQKIGYMYVLKFTTGTLNYLLNITSANLKYTRTGHVCIKLISWHGFFYSGLHSNCNTPEVGADKEEQERDYYPKTRPRMQLAKYISELIHLFMDKTFLFIFSLFIS